MFGRDGIGAFSRSKAFDRLIKLAGLWYPVDDEGRGGLGILWLDTEESTDVDEVVEVTDPLDMVRAIFRVESLDFVDAKGSGTGVREVGSTDLLLTLFFEVDTGIMEVEVPGFPGVWNPCATDLGLVGEEGLDFACELAVGNAKPIDFRGFGVSGVDEGAEGLKPWYQFRIQGQRPSQWCMHLSLYRPSLPSPFPPSHSLHRLPSVGVPYLVEPSSSPSIHRPVCPLRWMTG